jgi:AcrR family transcriptional regulator
MTRRTRDLSATRASILEAARELFTAHGYGGVGVREIAERAGADKALIVRYFGSKEGLFLEAVQEVLDVSPLLGKDRKDFGRTAAASIIAGCSGSVSPMMALLRSLGDPVAAQHLRDRLESGVVEPLAAWLGGNDAHARATRFVSYMFGFWISAGMMPLGNFRGASADKLAAEMAPILQSVVDEDV